MLIEENGASEPLMYTGELRFQVIMCLVLPQSLVSYSTTAILSTASIHTITSSATAIPTSTVSPTNNGKLTLHVCTCVHSWWPNHSILTILFKLYIYAGPLVGIIAGIVVACLVSVLLVSIGVGFTLLYFCHSKSVVVDTSKHF